MFLKLWLSLLGESQRVNFMRRKGIMLGTRRKKGRQVYTYMFRDLFAEITYKNDDPEAHADHIKLIVGLDKLNHHLEKETKGVR